jgi:hypothetical protein
VGFTVIPGAGAVANNEALPYIVLISFFLIEDQNYSVFRYKVDSNFDSNFGSNKNWRARA